MALSDYFLSPAWVLGFFRVQIRQCLDKNKIKIIISINVCNVFCNSIRKLTKGSIRAVAYQKRKENTECLATCLFFFIIPVVLFFLKPRQWKIKFLFTPRTALKIKLLSLSISVYGLWSCAIYGNMNASGLFFPTSKLTNCWSTPRDMFT